MSINTNFKNGTAGDAARSRERTTSNSAMHRWFECNQGVQRKSWPSVYQPNHQFSGLQKPDGVGEKYWDTLARAEKHWITDPVKSQFGDELTDFWNDRNELKGQSTVEYFVDAPGAQIYTMDIPQPPVEENFRVENLDVENLDQDKQSNLDFSARLINMDSARRFSTRERGVSEQPVQIFSRQFSYGALNPAWKFAASW